MAPVQAPMPPAMQPNPAMAVSIRGLFKRFGNKVAVNGLSLDIIQKPAVRAPLRSASMAVPAVPTVFQILP